MIPPIELALLSPSAQRVVATDAPVKVQELAARGVAPGIKPAELLSVLVLLASSERPTVAESANATLAALPPPLLSAALASDLAPAAIDALALRYAANAETVNKLLGMPQIAMDTVEELARSGTEAVTELIATNEERLLVNPAIIERLYMNKRTRMSTADRIIELAARHRLELRGIPAWKEAVEAIQGELIPEPSEEPTPDDIAFREVGELAEALASAPEEDTHKEIEEGKEVVKDKYLPLYARVAAMRISEKIRRATLGSKEERMLLVRDSNRLVASAAVRSPMIQEPEIAMISKNRNMSSDVLRIIGSAPEWLRSYTIKRSLVENPRTPVTIAQKLVGHLRESELRHIAKSKNITGPVQDAARRLLEKKKT